MTDPNWSNVVLFCNFDEGAGGTPLDYSNKHTLTLTGSTLSTAQVKYGASSLLVKSSATSDRVTVANHTDFQFGSGQFTIEAWVRYTSVPGLIPVAARAAAVWPPPKVTGPNASWWFGFNFGSMGFWYSTTGSDSAGVYGGWSPTINTWYHLCVDRDAANELRVYVDGAVIALATVSASFYPSTRDLMIGNDAYTSDALPGYIDDLRITKGLARYAGAFTPPAALSWGQLVNKVDLLGLDFVFQGQPFCIIAPDDAEVFGTLDRAFNAQPIAAYTGSSVPVNNVLATQAGVEAWFEIPSDLMATQVGAEAWHAITSNLRATQAGAEVWYNGDPALRATQVGAEVWRSIDGAVVQRSRPVLCIIT